MSFSDFLKGLQSALNAKGEGLEVDGIVGSKTLAALAKYKVSFDFEPVTSGSSGLDILTAAEPIIKEFEGLKLSAYLDSAAVPTIGWGTIEYPNGTKVKMGDKITQAQAEVYLQYEMGQKFSQMRPLIQVPLSNNAMCALLSFCYNLGTGALAGSTLLKLLNAGRPLTEVADQFDEWVNAKDPKTGKLVKVAGLVRRRAEEKALFLS